MSTPKNDSPVLLLLRRELRLRDNPALAGAASTGRPVVPIFILDDDTPGVWKAGGAQRWWLHHSLASLAAALREIGATLVLRRGPIAKALRDLVEETGASEIHAGQTVEPWSRELAKDLSVGVPVTWHRTVSLFDPDTVRTGSGGVYGVFTPFANACRARLNLEAALPAPRCGPAA